METSTQRRRPQGFLAVGIFFFFGAIMATLAAVTLLNPGTILDAAWVLNKAGHRGLMAMHRTAGLLFLVLVFALALAGTGWLGRRRWGWWLAVLIIATNLAGDAIRFAGGDFLPGSVGILFAGALLLYMTRPALRDYFQKP
jgi:hypothetical protein